MKTEVVLLSSLLLSFACSQGLAIDGSDFVLGANDGRDIGENTAQRALVHYTSDRLYMNFCGDFEGGTYIQGPYLNIQGKVGLSSAIGPATSNNDATGRGFYIWEVDDPNHVIYSTSSAGKSPNGQAVPMPLWDSGHRMRFRTYHTGQGFLFENSAQEALVDIDSDNGNLRTRGVFYSESEGCNYFAGHIGIDTTSTFALLTIGDRSRPTGEPFLQVGNDTFFTDVDLRNILGLYGSYNTGEGGLKLGSSGPTLYGASSNLGIGTTNPQNKLDVNGTIRAKEIIVESDWADFVFDDGYELPSLAEVQEHIDEFGHLPGIPKESDVQQHGVSLGEMNARLLQKVEELTIYTLKQEATINQQHDEIEELRTQVALILDRIQ